MAYDAKRLAELRELFRYSPAAVLLAEKDRILWANAAAETLFGRALALESVSGLWPALPPVGDGVASCTLENGRSCRLTAGSLDGLSVYTLIPETAGEAVPPGVLRRMRSAAAELRLSLDRCLPRESGDKRIGVLYRSYYSLLHSIEQLSDETNLAAGELPVRKTLLELGRLVWDLTGSVDVLARERGVSVSCRVPEGQFPVEGDRDRLEQLILILLSNSLSHTPEGGTVVLELRRSGDRILLTVTDDGDGLADQDMIRAFTAGEELPLTATGAGLGLHIAQGLARLHGGVMLLERRKDRGTAVTLSLPARPELLLRDAEMPEPVGPRRLLTELCDVLSPEVYLPKYTE